MGCDRGPTVRRHPGFREPVGFRRCRPVSLSDLVLAELAESLLPEASAREGLVLAAREVLERRPRVGR